MRNHMDRIELPFSPLNRSRHLSRGGFVVGEQDWLDIGADAGEQRCEVIDAAVDEGDLALAGSGRHGRSLHLKFGCSGMRVSLQGVLLDRCGLGTLAHDASLQ